MLNRRRVKLDFAAQNTKLIARVYNYEDARRFAADHLKVKSSAVRFSIRDDDDLYLLHPSAFDEEVQANSMLVVSVEGVPTPTSLTMPPAQQIASSSSSVAQTPIPKRIYASKTSAPKSRKSKPAATNKAAVKTESIASSDESTAEETEESSDEELQTETSSDDGIIDLADDSDEGEAPGDIENADQVGDRFRSPSIEDVTLEQRPAKTLVGPGGVPISSNARWTAKEHHLMFEKLNEVMNTETIFYTRKYTEERHRIFQILLDRYGDDGSKGNFLRGRTVVALTARVSATLRDARKRGQKMKEPFEFFFPDRSANEAKRAQQAAAAAVPFRSQSVRPPSSAIVAIPTSTKILNTPISTPCKHPHTPSSAAANPAKPSEVRQHVTGADAGNATSSFRASTSDSSSSVIEGATSAQSSSPSTAPRPRTITGYNSFTPPLTLTKRPLPKALANKSASSAQGATYHLSAAEQTRSTLKAKKAMQSTPVSVDIAPLTPAQRKAKSSSLRLKLAKRTAPASVGTTPSKPALENATPAIVPDTAMQSTPSHSGSAPSTLPAKLSALPTKLKLLPASPSRPAPKSPVTSTSMQKNSMPSMAAPNPLTLTLKKKASSLLPQHVLAPAAAIPATKSKHTSWSERMNAAAAELAKRAARAAEATSAAPHEDANQASNAVKSPEAARPAGYYRPSNERTAGMPSFPKYTERSASAKLAESSTGTVENGSASTWVSSDRPTSWDAEETPATSEAIERSVMSKSHRRPNMLDSTARSADPRLPERRLSSSVQETEDSSHKQKRGNSGGWGSSDDNAEPVAATTPAVHEDSSHQGGGHGWSSDSDAGEPQKPPKTKVASSPRLEAPKMPDEFREQRTRSGWSSESDNERPKKAAKIEKAAMIDRTAEEKKAIKAANIKKAAELKAAADARKAAARAKQSGQSKKQSSASSKKLSEDSRRWERPPVILPSTRDQGWKMRTDHIEKNSGTATQRDEGRHKSKDLKWHRDVTASDEGDKQDARSDSRRSSDAYARNRDRSPEFRRRERSPDSRDPERSPNYDSRRRQRSSDVDSWRRERSPDRHRRRDRSPDSHRRRDRSPDSHRRRDRSPDSHKRRDRSPEAHSRRKERSPDRDSHRRMSIGDDRQHWDRWIPRDKDADTSQSDRRRSEGRSQTHELPRRPDFRHPDRQFDCNGDRRSSVAEPRERPGDRKLGTDERTQAAQRRSPDSVESGEIKEDNTNYDASKAKGDTHKKQPNDHARDPSQPKDPRLEKSTEQDEHQTIEAQTNLFKGPSQSIVDTVKGADRNSVQADPLYHIKPSSDKGSNREERNESIATITADSLDRTKPKETVQPDTGEMKTPEDADGKDRSTIRIKGVSKKEKTQGSSVTLPTLSFEDFLAYGGPNIAAAFGQSSTGEPTSSFTQPQDNAILEHEASSRDQNA